MNEGVLITRAEQMLPVSDGVITLSRSSPDHDLNTVRWLNDSTIKKTFGLTRDVSLESHRQWLTMQNNMLCMSILDLDAKHVGNTNLRINSIHNQGYFEIYLGESDQRGRGYGAAALNLVLAIAFEGLQLHRVSLVTVPGNMAAEKLYKKSGFIQEGTAREAILRDGQYQDQKLWSILSREWIKKSGDIER